MHYALGDDNYLRCYNCLCYFAYLIPIISNNTIRSGAYLGYFSRYPMIAPQVFEGLVTFLGKEKWPAALKPNIFFSVFINVQTGRVSRLIVMHQENSAFLNEEEYSYPRSNFPRMESTCTRRTILDRDRTAVVRDSMLVSKQNFVGICHIGVHLLLSYVLLSQNASQHLLRGRLQFQRHHHHHYRPIGCPVLLHG